MKDRAALSIVQDAEARGLIRPGGTIVEGTAGNTGIGLALVASVRGYRTLIVIPETQSAEKKQTLRLAGARLVEVLAVPFANPNNYVHVARRLAERLAETEEAGAFFADQFDNVANRRAHVEGTGPELYKGTGGRIDGFVCAAGTGGTLAGVAEALRARNPQVRIALSDPEGSALHAYYTTGTLKLKAEFPNADFQLWPGQFVNVRLKVETLPQAIVIPTSAAQRGPAGTFSYVIGDDDTVTAKPITVIQQNETDAVIGSGLTPSDRVVTTGFANLADGSKVVVGKDEQTPSADLAPRKRRSSRDAQGAGKDGQSERRGKRGERGQSEGDQKGQTGPARGGEPSGSGAKAQP